MKKQGFIIPLVLMLISIIVMFATYMYQQGSLFVPYQSTMIAQEQARQLALGGIQVACAQLSLESEEQKKESAQKDEKEKIGRWHTFLKEILPKLNVWQTFELKKNIDGLNGEIKIMLTSEAGKIDLNKIYNFTKKSFNENWKKILPELFSRIQKEYTINTKLFDPFENFYKERHAKLNDATELLLIQSFRPFASLIFASPPASKKEKKSLYLTDIFTVYGKNDKIHPWLLSESMMQLLSIKKPQMSNEMMQALIKNFKPSMNWQQDWKTIGKPLFGVELSQLPKGIDATFDATFDPSIFSVVSYGKVGNVTQKAYAIIERSERTVKKKQVVNVVIKKIYWI